MPSYGVRYRGKLQGIPTTFVLSAKGKDPVSVYEKLLPRAAAHARLEAMLDVVPVELFRTSTSTAITREEYDLLAECNSVLHADQTPLDLTMRVGD